MRGIVVRSGRGNFALFGAIPMVGVGRGVNASNALSASHEIEERRATRCRGYRVGVVQETARGAVEENRIVLLQVVGVDVSQTVGDCRRPQVALVAERFHGLRSHGNRRVHESKLTCMREPEPSLSLSSALNSAGAIPPRPPPNPRPPGPPRPPRAPKSPPAGACAFTTLIASANIPTAPAVIHFIFFNPEGFINDSPIPLNSLSRRTCLL